MTIRKLSIQTILLLSILSTPLSSLSQETRPTDYYITPKIITTQNRDLSDIILKAYHKRFLSKTLHSNLTELSFTDNGITFINHLEHSEIEWCKWEIVSDLGANGRLFVSQLKYGNKLFFMHIRNHSWRGDIYTGFLIHSEKKLEFLKSFNENTYQNKNYGVFYPAGAKRPDDSSWVWNNVFRYKGGFYFIDDFNTFNQAKGIRYLYRIKADGTASNIGKFKIFKSIGELAQSKKFPAFISFWHTLHNIFGPGTQSQVSAGTLRAHDRARQVGHNAAARAMVRPWIVNAADKSTAWYGKYYVYNDRMVRFLEDWSLWENWNLREYQTLLNHIPAAEYELAKLYELEFGMKKNSAKKSAKSNIENVIAAYILVPGSYPEYRKNNILDFRKQVTMGTYSGSLSKRNIDNELSTYIWDGASGAEKFATFAIDNIDYLGQVLDAHKYSDLTNSFSKTLLMYATHMNHFDAVKYFVELGANVNDLTRPNHRYGSLSDLPKNMQRSALTYAAENGSIEIISLLLGKGAKIELTGGSLAPYLLKNPRFSKAERQMPLLELVNKYKSSEVLFKPGFDCNKAGTIIEKAICNNKTLSIYDRELGKAYGRLLKVSLYPKFDRKDQIAWLKYRDRQCGKLKGRELNTRIMHLTRSRTRYLHNRLEQR